MTLPRLFITPGEPAGIGPDITVQIAQHHWPAELVVIADPDLLQARAQQLHLPLQLRSYSLHDSPQPHQPSTLSILPVTLNVAASPGLLRPENATYVLQTLEQAASLGLKQQASAIVTGPVHKSIINQAGIHFSGHTEFFADYCSVEHTVMLFVLDQLKIALATTHLPLAQVPTAITKERLQLTLSILHHELQHRFGLATPHILVCGLNPHAGEAGYLGHEEIETIAPALTALRHLDATIHGPLPADTIFTPAYLQKADAILAMYHDQALPLVKYLGFGQAVNMTLGLPFVRTSVDHGTALDKAGTGHADFSSLAAAIKLAIKLTSFQYCHS
jgi:4-hydroxythreonine-4-phosphate dehydrogenase